MTDQATVTNIEGSSKFESCPICGPWIDHCESMSGRPRGFCSVHGCLNFAEVGAHVFVTYSRFLFDLRAYVVPMCREHNGKHGESFTLWEGCLPVLAHHEPHAEKLNPLAGLLFR